MDKINISYCSDKYQYTMGKSFLETGRKDTMAVFNLFYRKAPENNNWAVVSGTEEVIECIRNLGNEEPGFYEKFLPGEEYARFRDYLSSMRFTGNVYAMREGEIAFPNEPIVIVEAPLIEAQVLETPLLCIMNHQMAVATKASRVCRATDRPVSEFGSRRAHGPWAATYGAKAAIIAGCASTSNILTGAMNGVPSTGTMAHSFITSYGSTVEGEHQAFRDYINTHRGEGLILLIDTYDTLKCGVLNAIRTFRECGIDDSYPHGYGVRLDSGDLAYLSIKVRKILDAHGLSKCKIFATNSLDEYLITDLERQGARIDCYGVGDAIATSKAAPCFGNVYKLVQIDGKPVLKRSEDTIKLINPGFQITYRITRNDPEQGEIFKADVTCLRGDSFAQKIEKGEEFTVYAEHDRYKYKTFEAGTYSWKVLQHPVIEGGEVVATRHTLMEKKAYYNETLAHFSPSERRLINPHYYKSDISDDLYRTKLSILDTLNKEIEGFSID
ncbi:MAG: nicotinate phosphoribosyltransferase [Candidatus Cryptobacteroides sp.]|nr:nicotinate phosphoribosyltransferase [Bacteroidales bacterium]MDY5317189.1 nicotinate phosphoribosyltransferase [Candidatus Cryptobacteroides sp.]